MTLDYSTATYGRNNETSELFQRFNAGKNLSMLGPRRLGKTFVLNRLEERATAHGYTAIKFDVSKCADDKAFFALLCDAIEGKRDTKALLDQAKQRIKQILNPPSGSGPWYKAALELNCETFADQLVATLAEDERQWLILIDELPVFFLHLEQQPNGLAQVKNIAYRLRSYREAYPRLRWLITGSIGIEPLAQRGDYLGAFNNLEPYALQPLQPTAARDLLLDMAAEGLLKHRQRITRAEADAVVDAVGWLSAYYLDAFAQQLQGEASDDPLIVQQHIATARQNLLHADNKGYFVSWPEHISKNFTEPTRKQHFKILECLADYTSGCSWDVLLAYLKDTELGKKDLQRRLNVLEQDGFLLVDYEVETARFRIELLRLWWKRYLPE